MPGDANLNGSIQQLDDSFKEFLSVKQSEFLSVGFTTGEALKPLRKLLWEYGDRFINNVKTIQDKQGKEAAKQDNAQHNETIGVAKELLSNVKTGNRTADKIIRLVSGSANTLNNLKDVNTRNLEISKMILTATIKMATMYATNTYQFAKIASELSHSGIVIGKGTSLLEQSANGAYKTIQAKGEDFADVLSQSALLANKNIQEFAEDLKRNSQAVSRWYGMGIDGSRELGNQYKQVMEQNKTLSFENSDLVVSYFNNTVIPMFSKEEYMFGGLNTQVGILAKNMHDLSRATGTSVDNLLKEQQIKTENMWFKRFQDQHPEYTALFRRSGLTDSMMKYLATGKITPDLNMELLNTPELYNILSRASVEFRLMERSGTLKQGYNAFARNFAATLSAYKGSGEARGLERWARNLYMNTYADGSPLEKSTLPLALTPYMNWDADEIAEATAQDRLVENLNDVSRELNNLNTQFLNFFSMRMEKLEDLVGFSYYALEGAQGLIPNSSGWNSALYSAMSGTAFAGGVAASLFTTKMVGRWGLGLLHKIGLPLVSGAAGAGTASAVSAGAAGAGAAGVGLSGMLSTVAPFVLPVGGLAMSGYNLFRDDQTTEQKWWHGAGGVLSALGILAAVTSTGGLALPVALGAAGAGASFIGTQVGDEEGAQSSTDLLSREMIELARQQTTTTTLILKTLLEMKHTNGFYLADKKSYDQVNLVSAY
jgi:hypothetical protein